MTASSFPALICFRISSTGAALTRFSVKTPAAVPLCLDEGKAELSLLHSPGFDTRDCTDTSCMTFIHQPPSLSEYDDPIALMISARVMIPTIFFPRITGRRADALLEHEGCGRLDVHLFRCGDHPVGHDLLCRHIADIGQCVLGLLPVDVLPDRDLDDLEGGREPEIVGDPLGLEERDEIGFRDDSRRAPFPP